MRQLVPKPVVLLPCMSNDRGLALCALQRETMCYPLSNNGQARPLGDFTTTR